MKSNRKYSCKMMIFLVLDLGQRLICMYTSNGVNISSYLIYVHVYGSILALSLKPNYQWWRSEMMRWYDHSRLFGLMMLFFCILWWIVQSPLAKAKQSVTKSCHFSQLSVVKYYTILRYNILCISTFLSEGQSKGITTYCPGLSTKFNKIGTAVFRNN